MKKVKKLESFIDDTFGFAAYANEILFADGVIEDGLKKKKYLGKIEQTLKNDPEFEQVVIELGMRLMWATYKADLLDVSMITLEACDECEECCCCGDEVYFAQ